MKRTALLLAALATGCGNGDDNSSTVPDASSMDVTAPVEAAAPEPVVEAGPDIADVAPDPCADAAVPPTTIACTGLYADLAAKEIAPSAMAYTPSTPLWSDDAQKQRWIELPPNTKIDIKNPSEWNFPVGTKLFKEFRLNGKRVETRMFQKTTETFWVYATYAWNDDDSAATINYGGPVPVGDAGVTWNIPSNDDCNECHRGRQDRILGFEQVSLGLPGAQGLTLAQLVERDLVTPVPATVSLNVGDDGTGLSGPALAWLHVNCGVTCHNSNPSAAGNGAGMLLRLDPAQLDGSPPDRTWDILKTTINVPCVSGSLAGLPRIKPNNIFASAIHLVINQRGALQMPPIASQIVDKPDVAIVSAWIETMLADGGAPPDGGFQIPDGGFHFDGGFSLDGGHFDGGHFEAGLDGSFELDGAGPDGGPDAGDLDAADATIDNADATASGDDADDAGE